MRSSAKFRGRVPQVETEPPYEASDFQLVTLKDVPIFEAAIPSQFPSSPASGVRVIGRRWRTSRTGRIPARRIREQACRCRGPRVGPLSRR
jgi:hypothetical protein